MTRAANSSSPPRSRRCWRPEASGPRSTTAVLPEFLATRYVAGEDTFFQGIKALVPGTTLAWSPDDGLAERRYWSPPGGDRCGHGHMRERAEEVRTRLEGAVRSHLMSDVPLGLFLSGGIDSTGIAALMAPMVKEPIRTFAVGFHEPEASELGYARLAARAVGAEHHEVVVTPEEFLSELPRLIWHEDKPIAFPSSVALYFVSRLARDHVKVVLTGEGADELFLGYNWYRVTAWNQRLGRAYWALTPAALRRHGRPTGHTTAAGRTALRAAFVPGPPARHPLALPRELRGIPRCSAPAASAEAGARATPIPMPSNWLATRSRPAGS